MSFDYERHDVGDLSPENIGAAKAAGIALCVMVCLLGAALVIGIGLMVSGVLW